MENQHQKIKGYRDLTQNEIDLMNEIKIKGQELSELMSDVNTHLTEQHGMSFGNEVERQRINQSDPCKWFQIAETHFQQGLMALTRAVAQPTAF